MGTIVCPSFTNVYDTENRLTQTTVTGVTTSYDYDADWQRVKKSSGTLYWYGPGGDVLEETNLSGTLQNEYIFFGGKRTARIDASGAVHYYFSDHLGSADVITNTDGSRIEEESDYYPFGGERVVIGPGANHYKFTGKERDPETGCDYFGARYYCNPIGRFITPDWAAKPTAVPYVNFGNPQSLNLYSYVKNNPTTFGDPDGHCPGDDCNKITVTTEVSEEAHMTGWKIESPDHGSSDHALVEGNINYTFQYDGKPLTNTMVHEDVKDTMTVNGSPVSANLKTGDAPTDQNGKVSDKTNIEASVPSKSGDSNAAVNHMTTSAVTKNVTQVLTVKSPTGCTCSVTEKRALTNVTNNGHASSTYRVQLNSPLTQTAAPARQVTKHPKRPD